MRKIIGIKSKTILNQNGGLPFIWDDFVTLSVFVSILVDLDFIVFSLAKFSPV